MLKNAKILKKSFSQKKKKILKKTHSLYPFFPNKWILVGIFLLVLWGSFVIHNTAKEISFTMAPSPSKVAVRSGPTPTHITITSISADLSIDTTHIKNNEWEINKNGVSYLDSSARLNEEGNIILYAHNTHDRFGKIFDIKWGDMITITDEKGDMYKYSVYEMWEVSPTDINYLNKLVSPNTLTLYTCSGFLETQRYVVKAQRVQ